MSKHVLLLLGLLLFLLAAAACNGLDSETLDPFPEGNSTVLEQQADQFAAEGKLEEAYLHYGKALVADPKNYSALLKKGNILLQRGLGDQALIDYLSLIKETPKSPEAAQAHLGCGQILFAAGMSAQAIKHFDFALDIDQGLWLAHLYQGIVYNLEQKHRQAEMAFLSVLEKDPDNAEALNNLGLTYAMTGRYNDAVSAYRQAMTAGAPQQQVRNNLGLSLYRLGRESEALESFRTGPSLEDEAVAHNNLGYCFLIDGQYKEAVKHFEKAMELAPKFYVRAHETLKKAKTALALAEATEENPQFSQGAFTLVLGSHDNLGQALFQQENLQQMGVQTRILPTNVRGNGGSLQVVSGEYANLAEAREAQKQMQETFGIEIASIRPL